MTVPMPGAFSERPDTGGQPIRRLDNPGYGEQTQFVEQQKGAPLAKSDNAPAAPYPSDLERMAASGGAPAEAPSAAPVPSQPLGIFNPGDPSIPVTSGAPMGAGPNEIYRGLGSEPYKLSAQLQQYAPADGSEALAWLAYTLMEMGQ